MDYPCKELLVVVGTAACTTKNAQAARISFARGTGLPYQGMKAGLHKMLVKGQGLVYPCFAHDYERNAVR